MKKLVNIVKNGDVYQVGALTIAEATQLRTDIDAVSGIANANAAALLNVYTKAQTDSAITDAIAGIDKEIFVFADSLPTEDIKTNKIYVVPTDGATGTSNSYTEWLYNGTSWEKVGEFKSDTDLSNIYTKSEVDAAIEAAVNGLDKTWYGTQAMYDALEAKDPETEYRIYVED